jgi:ketosteroid isomerase-like protein
LDLILALEEIMNLRNQNHHQFAVLFAVLIMMTLSVSSCRTSNQTISTPTASNENVEQVLIQMEHEWAAAPANRDAATLERIIADDWVSFTWDGETITKTQVIADAKFGANTAQSISLEALKVRVFGDAAIVTGGVNEKSQYEGRDMSGHYLWTDVFVKRNGRWQAVASQTTRVGKSKS